MVDYSEKLSYHFKPQSGWINDPNGLVYFRGYYHVFYQHCPDFEQPWKQPMHWGHARTKDFLTWEELPIALYPDASYDAGGCWSGTAIVKDEILYLFYASIHPETKDQTVSVAFSSDGIRFEKYEGNPVIDRPPACCGKDFRDPALFCVDGMYFCVMAGGDPTEKKAQLYLYRSEDLIFWEYRGVLAEWEGGKYAECPSLTVKNGEILLAASVLPLDLKHYFSLMYGRFENERFIPTLCAETDKGPDQYAGQVFLDDRGRSILLSWMPGWDYVGFSARDIGCLSLPREVFVQDGRICAYPVEEVRHLLSDSDPALSRTEDGFVIPRKGRGDVVYRGEIRDLALLRDGYMLEVFVNGGETVYTVLL